MKILQFIYSLVPGGAERFVVDLTNELSKVNETVLYTLRDDTVGDQGFYRPEISKNVNYVNLKIKNGFKPSLIWKFYQIIKREMPDVVHCHLNLINYFFLSSILLRKKIRFIYTIHNTAKVEVKSGIEKVIRNFFFKYEFFIPVAISNETENSYQTYYNLFNTRLIYNGRQFSEKTINYKQVTNEINTLKPTRDTLVFCHPSRYHKQQKNQKMLVTVFNKLIDEGYDVILLIIGEGFEAITELTEIANNRIYFLGIKTNVTDYLYASDAFCLSSNYEGMPISLIEAFSCGCVPICTPVGGCVNAIEHGVTGFLSKTVSEEDYLDALKEYLKNKDTIDKANLINTYHQKYGIVQCASKYSKLYSER
ncbi:MAG: glycosyltransferase [Prolixibacteraceae bacterium]|nr:glycosyltransferase [Prolixibacteraceae bacterium]